MKITIDDLLGDEVANLLQEHINDMKSVSPPESKHALDLNGLRQPDVTFWSVWDNDILAGCGALKELSTQHAEVKSMRTSSKYMKNGIASKLLQHMIGQAGLRGYKRLSLETGSMAFFDPARKLYAKFGFEVCGPFSSYKEDPNSVFMTLKL